jgi:hypothetical protein
MYVFSVERVLCFVFDVAVKFAAVNMLHIIVIIIIITTATTTTTTNHPHTTNTNPTPPHPQKKTTKNL